MDPIAEWTSAQSRVIELTEALSPEQAETIVPACPDWSVRELLSHMIGLDADVLAGDEPDDHNSTWTQAQVDHRAGRDTATLCAEWRQLTRPLQEWMLANNPRPMGDAVIHEQDLRGALGVPGARDTAAIASLRDRFAGMLGKRIDDAGLAPLQLRGETWMFTAGTGGAAVEVDATDFDLARALIARRSAAQLRSWTVLGDIEPYLEAFAALGPLPTTDLTD